MISALGIIKHTKIISSFSHKTWTHVSYKLTNTMASDDLVTLGAQISAALVLNLFFCKSPVSAPEGLEKWS